MLSAPKVASGKAIRTQHGRFTVTVVAKAAGTKPAPTPSAPDSKSGNGAAAPATVEAAPAAASSSAAAVAAPVKNTPVINVIPKNGKWANGIPPVMGAHLMASGVVAPISTSKGAGIDVPPHVFQYFTEEGEAQVVLHATPLQAATTLSKLIVESADEAIKAKGTFTLVLSGGSLFSTLGAALPGLKNIAWDKVHVFFVDERNVPLTSSDSNYKLAKDTLLSKVNIPAANVHAILENLPVQLTAKNYEGRLIGLPPSVLPTTPDHWPVFDLILLGLGPDGHIASLFPNRKELAATSGWVVPVTNSPKPPSDRVSFTLPVINSAKEVIFVALGDGKSDVVQRTLEVQALPGALPAQLVRPKNGKLRWLLDVQSAQLLNIEKWGDAKAYPRSQ